MATASSSSSGSRWPKVLIALIVLCGAGYGIFYYGDDLRASLSSKPGEGDDEQAAPLVGGELLTASVAYGPFELMLNVQGHLDSQSNATLSSQVEGTTTIISIVPEGTWVEKGEIVCELDSSALSEDLKQQQIDVTQAEATLTQATESLEITREQNKSDIAAAQLALMLAKLDLVKYEDGEYPALQRQLAGVVAIEMEEYRRAEEDYEFTKRLVRKGYETPSDLESKRIAVKREELELQKSREDLKVLTEYTKKRDMAELSANVTEFERELTRTKLQAKSAEAQASAEVAAAKLTLEVEKEKFERDKQQLAACTLRASQAGEVVYANLAASRRGGSEGAAIEEGATVRERQAIINLPDVTRMKVDCRIHESLISQISNGLAAAIRVDAYPDEIFNGTVSQVSSVPMTGSWPNYDLREYQTEIRLTDEVDKVRKLRPGLTAQVEIYVDRRQKVLQVPQQAVVKAGRKTLAYVIGRDGTASPRMIDLGMTNSTSAEVVDGLEDGDRVVLNPRKRFAEEIAKISGLDRDEAASEGDDVSNADDVSSGEAGRGDQPKRDQEQRNQSKPAAKKASPGGVPGGGAPNVAAMLKRLDKDGNGTLSKSETPAGMAAAFDKIDADGDGELSASELSKVRPAAGGRPQ